ncbi:MAG: hypothetical protein AAF797_09500 [Planctomycetota bacterium]
MSEPKHCEAMIGWWWATLVTTVLVVLLFPLERPVYVAAGMVLVGGSLTLMLVCLYRAARAGGPRGYAPRQLTVALLLMPALLLGFLIVPWLVRSDLQKWALAESGTAPH